MKERKIEREKKEGLRRKNRVGGSGRSSKEREKKVERKLFSMTERKRRTKDEEKDLQMRPGEWQ